MNCKINGLLLIAFLMIIGCGISNDRNGISTEYASTKCLSEIDEIKNAGPRLKLIDLRKPKEYDQGHIPRALNVWRNQITDTSFAYDGMMATRLQMELLMGQLGITPTDTIVIYDQNANCDAARLWWILKFYGHQNVKLLNGSLTAWLSSGGKLSVVAAAPDSTTYRFTTQADSSILALADMVEAQMRANAILLDVRGTDEFSGETHKNGAAYPGHIEGAVNLDWTYAVDYNGSQKFLNAPELRQRYAAIGIDGTQSIITYCHSGVRSAHTFFVLTELLGYRNIKNYDGSWTEWSHQHPK